MTDKAAHASLPLTAVIFDCDGILVDTEPLHYQAFQKVLVPLGLGHSVERYMEEFIGFDDRDAFVHAFREAGRKIDTTTLGRLIEAKARALQELVEQEVPTFPGVVELVRELAAGNIPMAVASGALRHEVEAFIRSLGLADAFCAIVAADDVKKSKPDPETYIAALERLKETLGWTSINPARCIAIEDTPAGILSAKTAGLFAVAVTNSFPRDQLAGADHVVDSLSSLHLAEMVNLVGPKSGANS